MPKITAEERSRQILCLDGLTNSFLMADLAYDRLLKTLDLIEPISNNEAAEQLKISAILDTWTIIDVTHWSPALIQELRGCSIRKRPQGKVFMEATTPAEGVHL